MSNVQRSRLRVAVLCGVFTVSISACGGGGRSNENTSMADTPSSQSTPPSTAPARAQDVRREVRVPFASVATIPLASLGVPADLAAERVHAKSDAFAGLRVQEGAIRFVTPSDRGEDVNVSLVIGLSDRDVVVPVRIVSERPTEIVSIVEANESPSGSQPKAPPLVVKGLGAGNALIEGPLTFSVENAPPLDVKGSSATIYSNRLGKVFDLAEHWRYDAANHQLVVPASAMAAVLKQLPADDLDVEVGLSSFDGEFAFAYSFLIYKPVATLHGTVVDNVGKPLTSFAGRFVAIRGQDNRTRQVASIDNTGAFSVAGLTRGTYQVVLLDTQRPDAWIAVVPVFADSTAVDVKLVVAQPGVPVEAATASRLGRASDRATSTIASSVTQNGTPPPARPSASRVRPLAAAPTNCESTLGTTRRFTVQAGDQGLTVTCVFSTTVPKGTQQIGITATIFTEEFPVFTQARSIYNDSWYYSVSGLPGFSGESGLVNDSHYASATIRREVCVDIASSTLQGDFTFNGSLGTSNVGDALLPTTVTIDVALQCATSLRVTDARITSPNASGFEVVTPLGHGNNAGRYVSIPTQSAQTAQTAWGFGLDVKYEPTDVEIKSARIGLQTASGIVFASADVLAQTSRIEPGHLVFASLALPRFDAVPFSGKSNLVVELHGMQDGKSVVSNPSSDPSVSFNGEHAFTPLFLADDRYGARRYGVRDPGGDSWATFDTIEWLGTSAYRFDDISALHVAQFAHDTACGGDLRVRGDSVLCHHGHSDGAQVDLRYSDGSGGYTDALGGEASGAAIKSLLQAASAEVDAQAAVHPKLDAALAWIRANRAMIASEAPGARSIYVGPQWMKLALLSGRFPDQRSIPGAGEWSNKPAVVGFVMPHLHHWHIGRKSN